MSPHDWKEYYDTMPPYSVCRRCGCVKSFNPRTVGTYYTIPGGVVNSTGEPQCRPKPEKPEKP